MTAPILTALALVPVMLAVQAASEDPSDPRLGELITLDGEHPWVFDGGAETWTRRASDLRRRILVAGGLWPMDDERPPVEAVVHGRIVREGYYIQRVFFETWPGFYLTGNLYMPSGVEGPLPAVLSPHGHRAGGRLSERSDQDVAEELTSGAEDNAAGARYYIQARCHQLARMGCVVFHYDMVGYGDSKQIDHRDTFVDLEAIQFGLNAFGFQTYNSVRALDFLLSVPRVDPTRIGVTGASGGGTQTFILGAIDARPAAAFPAVMVSTNMQGGCVCENAPHLRVGTNNVAIAACFAPRPLAMSAANDWTLNIETLGLPQLRTIYGLLGSADHVWVRTWPEFGHNYNRPAREMMYAWFNEHLDLGQSEPVCEAPFVPVDPSELSVFDGEHLLPDGAMDAAGIRGGMIELIERRMQGLVPRGAEDVGRFRRVVGGALASMIGRPQSVFMTAETVLETSGARELWTVDPHDGGPPVRVWVLRPRFQPEPTMENGDVCVAVSGAGSAALLDPDTPAGATLAGLLAQGITCVVPIGILGDSAARLPIDTGRHGTYAGYTFGYNRTLLAERVRDLLTAIEAFGPLGIAPGRDGTPEPRTLLWGEGDAGPWTLLAAAQADGQVDAVVADWSGDFESIRDLAHPNLLPGALGYGGLDAFTGLVAPVPVTLCGRDEPPAVAAACYGSVGAGTALRVTPDGSAEKFPGF